MEVTINEQQALFVIPSGGGYSCMGFDVVYNHCMELAKRIKSFRLLPDGRELAPIRNEERGTLRQYEQYRDLLRIIGNRKIGTWFDFETPAKVRSIIEAYRKDGGRLRVFYGDTKTGRCWMEENDVVGRIGRSCGTLQIPLLIEEGECGGPGLLDSCIVRLVDADTRGELYRHAKYHLPDIEIRPVGEDLRAKGYTDGAWVKSKDGKFENHANFRSMGKAAQWVAFMAGECTEQPA